jgi:hypothetical protein
VGIVGARLVLAYSHQLKKGRVEREKEGMTTGGSICDDEERI